MDERALPTAGFWRRYAAYAIDSIVLGIPAATVLAPYDAWAEAWTKAAVATARSLAEAEAIAARCQIADMILGALLIQVVMALPAALCLASRWQATPGKALFGLCVTDERLERPSFGRALSRELAKLPSAAAFGLGILAIGWRRDRRGWHDLWAGTFVMKRWPLASWKARYGASFDGHGRDGVASPTIV